MLLYFSRLRQIRVWRSLVSRLNGVQEASSSNLDTRTKKRETTCVVSRFFFCVEIRIIKYKCPVDTCSMRARPHRLLNVPNLDTCHFLSKSRPVHHTGRLFIILQESAISALNLHDPSTGSFCGFPPPLNHSVSQCPITSDLPCGTG